MKSEALKVVERELRFARLKYRVDHLGKHIVVRWTINGVARETIVAASDHDRRAPANARSIVRRMLREDGFNSDISKSPIPVNKTERTA